MVAPQPSLQPVTLRFLKNGFGGRLRFAVLQIKLAQA
jgi:hypothetical protein